MALSEDEELELLELENEEAAGMKDAPADAPAVEAGLRPNPLGVFGDAVLGASQFMNPLSRLTPDRLRQEAQGFERALLTNEPTQGIGEGFLRGAPAAIGGAVGGTAGLVAGTPLTAGALGTSMAGAALGGSAFEAARQGIAQAYSGLTGRGEVKPASYVVRDIAKQGLLQAPGQAINLGVGLLGKYGAQQLPSGLQQFFGIPAPVTKYVQGRGAQQVFTPENLQEGAARANITKAVGDIGEARSATGELIGSAEDVALQRVGNKTPGIRHIREGLEKALYGRGITDPKTAGLARSKEAGILTKLRDALTPSETTERGVDALGLPTSETITEKLTLRQAINAKRLIDDNLEFAGKELGSATEQLLKKTNHQLRESVRADMGKEVGDLWDKFGVIADAQEKLAQYTGSRGLDASEKLAVGKLRGIMTGSPEKIDGIIKVLGAGLPGGEAQARQIFDAIAAESFSTVGIGAPSSALLKGAAAVGITSGPMARQSVRAVEGLNRLGAQPLITPRLIGPAATALEDQYNRR